MTGRVARRSVLARRSLRGLLLVTLGAVLGIGSLEAQVKWKTGPDGRRVMYNDAPKRRTPRQKTPVVESREVAASASSSDTVDLTSVVNRYAALNKLDPALVHAVIRVESAYNPGAVSNKGAIGLMQLMPGTARELSVSDPYDPEQNVRGGSRYLRLMLDRFDNRLEWALAGYNAGPGAVERYDGIPPYTETIDYVEKVIRIYRDDQGFALPKTVVRSRGRKTYLVERGGRMVMTTSRPDRR